MLPEHAVPAVPNSVLFLGRPGVGKTTVIREMARVLADDLKKRVVIVDTSNEIGGDGDVPHPAIGSARRMQVADPSQQHRVMVRPVLSGAVICQGSGCVLTEAISSGLKLGNMLAASWGGVQACRRCAVRPS